jgi:TRAP-type C4-dicarboxylate transport system permease small subunit
VTEKEHFDRSIQPEGTSVPSGFSSFERGLSKLVSGLDKLITSINRVIHGLSKVVLFILMWLTCLDVLGRYLFNRPITGTYELTGLFMIIIVFLSFSVTQAFKEHVEITFLTDKFSPKGQAVLGMIIYLIFFLFLVIVVWQFVFYTQRLYDGHDISTNLRIPLYLFSIIATIGMAVFALQVLREFFFSWLKVVERK